MRISISVPRRVCVVLLLVVVGAVAVVLLVPSDWRDETLLIPLRSSSATLAVATTVVGTSGQL